MSEQKIPYNQIDFVVLAPKFRIVFSYMKDQGVSFVREYLLRLLKLTPCKPTQIAKYFGFSKHETEIALTDLERNRWINWQTDGTIALSAEGLQLFQGESPQIPNLQEHGGTYCMELLDRNFLQQKDYDKTNIQAIELSVENEVRSNRKALAQKAFQHRFRQLLEDDIISLNDKDIVLYKIDVIESKGDSYFRFTQYFELLPETGEPKERHDVPNVQYQDYIQQAITAKIEQYRWHDNLRELRESMNELGDDDTLKVLFGGRLDFAEFLKMHQKYDEQNGLYFLGQIYHQEEMFKKINSILDKLDKKSQKKLYWLAPSDIYWGKQRKIHDKIQNFIDKSKDKYDFRLYLPMPSEYNNREKQYQHKFKEISKKHLYAFCEGFLEGNTEILFLEDKFAVVCYHAKLADYPVTLPIGFMTTKASEVGFIQSLAEKYLSSIQSDKGYGIKDFGLLEKIDYS
ncbi:hypothetical protein IO44_02465 [Gallibacterium anatis str. Avicor]|uniref:hypothetical protein n=1 Tax=Gallibacterium anatis TaxID=750 RepID=UPI00053142CF|nr:hypothetical protein [Gallibacterium anatis]KGQ56539.1 hypothetical protein IO44_02465 [Gallibacterium anatis str. Avicor]